MLSDFDKMPDSARLWVYQANRPMSPDECAFVEKHTHQFLTQWQAHGQDLKAAFRIEYHQFLVISLDESFNRASGCSIDSSVHLIKALEKEMDISFMTTGQVAFLLDEKIELHSFNGLREKVENQLIQPQTKVFDNTVKNLAEFRQKWLVPSSQTWVNKYFK